ncbi:MAG: zinc-binding dehydrogenase [Planctomycetales bacterium]|nr:zinc-binding dehydrogenase [Planctomycetales bacterium]
MYEPRKLRFVEVDEPQLTAANQIVFQPELGCLCGSDLPYFDRDYHEFFPQVGQSLHEMIGRVVDTNGDRFAAGDRVLCVPVSHFGLCERFAVSQENAIPLLPGEDEHLLMAQPLGTVICALRKLPNLMNWNVVVMGQGPMGQIFNAALRMAGAKQIIAVDPVPERLAVSPRTGATATIQPGEQDVVEAVADLTGGQMADLVVEVVGHREQQVNLCVELCRRAGKLLLFGVPCEKLDDLNITRLFWKNLTVHTSVAPDFAIDFPLAMQWISEGRIDLRPIITHRYPLAEIQAAFDLFRDRRDGALKVLIDFPRT